MKRMTHRFKNITLPQTSFAGGKYIVVVLSELQTIINALYLSLPNISDKTYLVQIILATIHEFPTMFHYWKIVKNIPRI